MRLDLGSRTRSSDGQIVGKIRRIIFEPQNMRIREFVVRLSILHQDDRIVRRALIAGVDDDHVVSLNISSAQVHELPIFIPEQHTPVYSGDYAHARQADIIVQPGSVPRDAVVLSHGSQVYDTDDDHIGHLDEIEFDDEGAATAFIVDAGFLFDHEVVVPADAVKSITHNRIQLNVRTEDVGKSMTAEPAAN